MMWRRVLCLLSLSLCAAARVTAQDRVAAPVLTDIAAIRALSLEQASLGYPVRVRGIVTHFDLRRGAGLVIHDGHSGQYVQQSERGVAAWRSLQLGDLIEIEGETKRGGFAPNVRANAIRTLGLASMPRASAVPYSALLTGRYDCDYVVLVGVIQRAWDYGPGRTLFADVAAEGGIVRATFWDYTPADIERLVGAEVRLTGNASTLQDETGHLRGLGLLVNRTRDVVVVTPAEPPFSLPVRPLESLYRHAASGEPFRRIRVTGVVTAYIPGQPLTVRDNASGHAFSATSHVLYIQDGSGVARVETDQDTPAKPGDRVDVAGFPYVTPGKPVLRHAVFRVVGAAAAEPDPVALIAPFLLTPDRDASLVSLQARLLAVVTSDRQRALVLEVGDAILDAALQDAPAGGALDDIPPGSLVTVTGVYAYQAGSPPSFRLFLRSPRDIALLQAAPWWTPRHTAVTAAVLAIALGAAGLWAWTSARRRRQRYQAILGGRTRVARELHDTLEQGLAGIALQLEAVAGTLGPATEPARRPLDLARHMLRYSLEEARRSVLDLRSQALESTDLPGALAEMARSMTAGTGVIAEVRVMGPSRRLDAEQEHHLLRIGLEAVTNALKHARPRRIDIDVRFAVAEMHLVVRDDGCGLAAEHRPEPTAHFGLRGIRERVDKLGGVLRIDGGRDAGTTITVMVPSRPVRKRIA